VVAFFVAAQRNSWNLLILSIRHKLMRACRSHLKTTRKLFMPNAISLWWSLLWRITLFIFVISFVMAKALYVAFPMNDAVSLMTWRPTIIWWGLATSLWIVSTVSARLLSNILWGDRLALSLKQWRKFGRDVAIFFLVLGIANLLVANLTSTETWVNFKLFVPYPLLMALLGFISRRFGRSTTAELASIDSPTT